MTNLWNWLPAFRAVAETENVHEAARQLCISPSALSRTIRLLEEEFGVGLFERCGRNLQLTALGRQLLEVVQRAMRSVDDVLCSVDVVSQTLRVAISAGLCDPIVMRAVSSARLHDRPLTLAIAGDPERDPVHRLLVGDLDVVLTFDAIHDERVCTRVVRDISFAVYARSQHPLVRRGELTLEAIARSGFVGYPAPPLAPADRWPHQLARVVSMYVHDARFALGVCRESDTLAVLPDLLVAETAEGKSSGLLRVPLHVIAPAPLFAVHRRSTSAQSPAEALLRALCEEPVAMASTLCAEH